MKLTSLPWLLVPGMGQIRGGAPGLGVAIFAGFILALNGCFLASLLTAREDAPFVLGIAALAIWVASLIDGIRRRASKSP